MNKKYIIGSVFTLVLVLVLAFVLSVYDKKVEEKTTSAIPHIGQKIWTYNMNKRVWKNFDKKLDDELSKEIIILQVQYPLENTGLTSYHLISGNSTVPKEDVLIGENSQEFIKNKKMYSYFPRNFEFYEVVFNGVKFIPRKLTKNEVSSLFKDFEIIDVSTLEKGSLTLKYTKKNNKFMILNDSGEDFYKYYIVPNDSKKMEIGDYSNQFILKDKAVIKVQRLEGCSKAYPCYEIDIK